MDARLRIGVAGLGRAFVIMLPTLARHPAIRLVAAADPRAEARARFEQDFAGRAYETVEAMCADPEIDVVYVASPHALHVEHVRIAAAHGRHVLCEKPMALTVAECEDMIAVTKAAGVHLLIGHSHSYDLPYLHTRALIDTGAFGAVRMITAINFTDFLYRPRRPEELDTAQGGGAVHNQAPHQVEVVRLLAGRPATSIRAQTGIWDADRPTEGAYTAQLAFVGGAVASLTYNGYGRFDTDALCGWIGELGQARDPNDHGAARRRHRDLGTQAAETAAKNRRAYGSALGLSDILAAPPPAAHNHFGVLIVSCEHGDLRPMPDGVEIYTDNGRRFEPLPAPAIPRAEVIDELVGVISGARQALHSGEWGLATTEIVQAILYSSRAGQDIDLLHQAGNLACP